MLLNRKFIISVEALLISMALLLIIQISIRTIQTKDQILLTQKILHYSELVATQLSDAINKVITSKINKCDNQSLNKLRNILWNSHDIIDLGIVKNGRVVCTAGWGGIDNNRGYISSDYTSVNGYSFNKNVKDILPTNVSADATVYRDVVAFTSPYAFNQVKLIFSDISFAVRSNDGKYVFLENHGRKINDRTHAFPYASIDIEICGKLHGLCVNSFGYDIGIFTLPTWSLLLIVLFCMLLGLFVSYLMNFYLLHIRSFEYRLKKAILSRKLYLEYQPIVQVDDNKIMGVEVLVRWKDKYYGQVSPELFITTAEHMNLYGDISTIVINLFTAELNTILIENDEFTASINIGSQEIQNQEYLSILYDTIMQHGIKPSQIKIEITERIVDSYKKIAEFSWAARNKGFIVSLDDFGTGSANMTWLSEVDFDEIKIDKFYVHGFYDEYKKKILISILELAKSLNPQLVFEGVENKNQVDFIKANFPKSYVQGWMYYKSMNKDELLKVLMVI